MTRLSLIFLLAAAALTAFSAEAGKTGTFHIATATVPSPTTYTKKHVPHAAAPSPAYQDYSLLAGPCAGFYECLDRVTEECGLEIYRGVFGKGGAANIDKKEIKVRDHKIWSRCVSITNLKVGNSDLLPILPYCDNTGFLMDNMVI
ncbi:hypothetical protein CDL12_13382 [Handroanthus impetiginosus]|uniref:Prolamin-like domain-containing protein n=1 Tax=Handroanthus impetiginosus TaxID=429701 RepID=A0A2G9H8Z7_9LAMI|nr:hypothetical protein CDL12_13382 [Handroanthus impetiginosus]